MDKQDFDNIVSNVIDNIHETLQKKNKEYATDNDVFSNFNEAAKMMGWQNTTACIGMANKHIVSVYDMVKKIEKGILPSVDFVNEKIGDSINYLILLKAMIFEQITQEKKGKLQNGQ